ncbi:MAG: aminopeptidase [Candidatus Micrarchaeota archaeon]
MLKEYAVKRLKDSFGAKKSESVLIITDDEKKKIGEAFYEGAKKVCSEVGLIVIKSRKYNREEPPSFVAEAMKRVDIVVMATTTSFTHTTARIEASKAGARIASMPGITEELIRMDFKVDYRDLFDYSKKLLVKLKEVREVRVTTKLGTDITFSAQGRSFRGFHEGLFLEKGQYGNLPAGEIYIAPLEGTANGRIVVDASMAGVGKLREKMRIEVRGGYATDILGGVQARKFKKFIWGLGKNERNLAEFGIGTNPYMRVTGEILGDEKVRGTCHFALGDNLGFGGKNKAKIHNDGVVRNPTIYADGKIVVKDGKLV